MKRKYLLCLLIGAYMLLGFALTVSRILARPPGDTMPTIGLIANAILYLFTSLGVAWLMEILIERRIPAVTIAKRRRVKIQHLRRKQKGVVCSQESFRSIRAAQQEIENVRTQ